MPQVINTNVSSLNSQRQLNRTQIIQTSAMERLSSGLRINSAKDDAAGLGIADRMTAQVRGLDQAVRNANDGISLSQVAEGALQESTNILQRIRELSVQSANDSNSASDRASLQKEVNQLKQEFDRIALTTSFNGKNILDGSFSSAQFQVGANANQTIAVSIVNAQANSVGVNRVESATLATGISSATNTGTNTVTAQTAVLNGSLGSASVGISNNQTAKDIAASINGVAEQTGINATAQTNALLGGFTGTGSISLTLTGSDSASISGTDAKSLSDAINAVSGKTGITAEFDSGTNAVLLKNINGEDIKFTVDAADAGVSVDVTGLQADGINTVGGAVTLDTAAEEATVGGSIDVTSAKSFSITGVTAGNVFNLAAESSDLIKVSTIDIGTQKGANDALKIIDGALSAIGDSRSDLGAIQNRFGSTISNLENVSQNVSAARSRIQDADFAKESANLARGQILQQAGTAMLAQANATSQNVLSLLQG
ncbi:MAG: flagellin [Gammaproteobacteria bacterium HGW-Gammaproteobacteria-3]|nr:MAG: flagellin [Gammaproteobacteria bacterium HGW-Gammaproteobacteria-3]